MKITVAPNVHSEEPTRPIPDCIDEWQIYSHQRDPWAPSHLPLAVEAGAVKEGDRCDGRTLRAEVKALASRGRFHMVSMDEPLVAGIRPLSGWRHGFRWPHGHCVDHAERQVIFDRITAYVRIAKQEGLKVNWIEAWPQHDVGLWLEGLQELSRASLRPDRLTVDADPYVEGPMPVQAMQRLRTWCNDNDVELACIAMGMVPHDFLWPKREGVRDMQFFSYAWKHFLWLHDLTDWDRVVFQSWVHAHDKAIPSTDVLCGLAEMLHWHVRHDRLP